MKRVEKKYRAAIRRMATPDGGYWAERGYDWYAGHQAGPAREQDRPFTR
jgi:hypothetical protein